MDWVLQNWEGVLAIAIATATAITRITPTPRDDALLAKLTNLLGRLSVVEHHDSGRLFKLPGKKTASPPSPGEMLD